MTLDDEFAAALKTALAAPKTFYMLAATLGEGEKEYDLALAPVQAGTTIDPVVLESRLRGEALAELARRGIEAHVVAGARIFLAALPDAKAEVDQRIAAGKVEDAVLLDTLHFTAFCLQLGLDPVDRDEVAYNGVIVWRSTAG